MFKARSLPSSSVARPGVGFTTTLYEFAPVMQICVPWEPALQEFVSFKKKFSYDFAHTHERISIFISGANTSRKKEYKHDRLDGHYFFYGKGGS
jgi:hypothetical protein